MNVWYKRIQIQREREKEREGLELSRGARIEKHSKMTSLASLLFSIAVAESVSALTPTMFYDCEQYPGDQFQQIDKTRRECIRGDVDGTNFVFCKHWQCETPQCSEEDQTLWPDGCKACPGMCSSGGKFHPLGSGFKCVDNVNTCSCSEDGGFSTTFVGFDHFTLCNASMS